MPKPQYETWHGDDDNLLGGIAPDLFLTQRNTGEGRVGLWSASKEMVVDTQEAVDDWAGIYWTADNGEGLVGFATAGYDLSDVYQQSGWTSWKDGDGWHVERVIDSVDAGDNRLGLDTIYVGTDRVLFSSFSNGIQSCLRDGSSQRFAPSLEIRQDNPIFYRQDEPSTGFIVGVLGDDYLWRANTNDTYPWILSGVRTDPIFWGGPDYHFDFFGPDALGGMTILGYEWRVYLRWDPLFNTIPPTDPIDGIGSVTVDGDSIGPIRLEDGGYYNGVASGTSSRTSMPNPTSIVVTPFSGTGLGDWEVEGVEWRVIVDNPYPGDLHLRSSVDSTLIDHIAISSHVNFRGSRFAQVNGKVAYISNYAGGGEALRWRVVKRTGDSLSWVSAERQLDVSDWGSPGWTPYIGSWKDQLAVFQGNGYEIVGGGAGSSVLQTAYWLDTVSGAVASNQEADQGRFIVTCAGFTATITGYWTGDGSAFMEVYLGAEGAPPLRLSQRHDGHGKSEKHARMGRQVTAATPDRSPRMFGKHGDNAYR